MLQDMVLLCTAKHHYVNSAGGREVVEIEIDRDAVDSARKRY